MTEPERILYVGIAGKKRHGKDTFATYLKDSLHQRQIAAIRHGFADVIREEVAVFLCRELAGNPKWPSHPCNRLQQIMQCLASDKPEEKEPFRLLMQWWGVEFRRGIFGDDYCLRAMESFTQTWLLMVPEPEKLVVLVPDVRLPNEVTFIRDHGGLLVKVFRPGMNDTDSHATETALDQFDGWDTLILNDGELCHLQQYAAVFSERCVEDRR